MKYLIVSVFLSLGALWISLSAQQFENRQTEGEEAVIREQTEQLFALADPLTEEASRSTLSLYNRRGILARGVVVGEERLLTKWSDLVGQEPIYVASKDGSPLAVEVVGYYADEDLVLLNVPGLEAPPIAWGTGEDLKEGQFVVAVGTQNRASAMGVVSVAARNFRVTEEGFLGIGMDARFDGPGVRVSEVTGGGAAEKVGILRGDVILEVMGDEVAGLTEMQTRIRRQSAGDEVPMVVLRNGERRELRPVLKGFREEGPRESRVIRLQDRLSGSISQVRDNFPRAIQTDIELEANDAGSPVVDLSGEVVGLVLARRSRVSTLVLPSEEVVRILKTEPKKSAEEGIARPRVVPE